jgi:hypothetical protein
MAFGPPRKRTASHEKRETMRPRFVHPFWLHTPAIGALAVFLVLVFGAGPLPADGPTHFGPDGHPNAYGSPALVFLLLSALCAGFIALSFWLDELWARQESRKTFNWLTLMDEVTVGAMTGLGAAYLRVLAEPTPIFTYGTPVGELLLFTLPTVAVAVYLELRRPYSPTNEQPAMVDTALLRKEMEQRMRQGDRFVYTDVQSPLYLKVLVVVIPLILFLSAALQAANQPLWSVVLMVALGILFLMMFGGLRTTVTRDAVTVHFGTPGIRVLKLAVSDIEQVTVRPFRPLAEFGGYGIRVGRTSTGYFLKGGSGVELVPRSGRRRLIGSDEPHRLAEVIRIAAGLPAGPRTW